MKNLINRRNFIKAGAGIFLTGAGFFAGCGRVDSENDSEIDGDLEAKYLRQIVSADSSNSRTLMWQVDSVSENPAVEVKIKNSHEVLKITPENSTFTDDGAENIQYTARIENLIPGTEYEYRIVDGKNATDFHALKTSSGEKFKAIIFPDSQCADYNVWGEVARTAFEKNPDAEFFLNLGDIVDNGEDKNQWQAWLDKVAGNISEIPFAPVIGNHETYTRDWKVRLPAAYLNYFAVPENGSENFSRHYYSFDFGAVHFAVLDSQWDEIEKFKPGIVEEQKKWLRSDFEKSRKNWKIVFIHKDVLQYRINGRPERKEGFSDVGEIFMPEFEKIGADIVFTGHLHTYRNRGRLKNFRPDESGPVYILTGLSGDVRYPGLWVDHKLDKITAPQPETDNYLTLEADEKILTVKCFLPDGKKIDEIILNKEKV